MHALQEWGKNRFKPIAMLSQIVAVSAESCHELILKARGSKLIAALVAQSTDREAWFQMYRHRAWLEGAMLNLLYAPESTAGVIETRTITYELRRQMYADMRVAMAERRTGGAPDRRRKDVYDRVIDRYYSRVHLPIIEELLSKREAIPPNAEEWLATTEVQFFLTVAAPCWLAYQTPVWVLYAQASRGKFAALEKLLRIDPDVDQDSRVGEQVFQLRRRKPAQYDLLQQARQNGQRSKITVADTKFLLGGLLMKLSAELQNVFEGKQYLETLEANTPPERLREVRKLIKQIRQRIEQTAIKCRLKSPDIKALFDAVARDRGMGLIDPDFSQQPHAIYKRLSRNSGYWPTLRKVDKIRPH